MSESAWLLEASWEVCNKVGGIHTVITSKLPSVLQEYGDMYLSIGPWFQGSKEFTPEEELTDYWKILEERLALEGIVLHYGRWEIPGRPKVVLLDWQGMIPRLDALKTRFWEEHALDTLGTDFYDFDTPLLWGAAVGIFAMAVSATNPSPVTLQLHEWLSASATLVLPKTLPNLRTIFTTHATVLGRSLASRNVPIYDQFAEINPDQAARECGVIAKHQLERLGARLGNAFTTVSSLTGEEATHFLGRTPDVITENGVAIANLPNLLDLYSQAKSVRHRLGIFIDDYFAPSYQFESRYAMWQCSTGRLEAHNKGYDLYLQALGKLNEELKRENKDSVVALLFIATGNLGIREEALKGRVMRGFGHKEKILTLPNYEEVPISPYNTHPSDPIPALAYANGLRNRQEDKVKLLYFPAYLDGYDGLLNEELYDLVSACDLGVFPSFYEPWGYTPMESVALGVPAITSDLAGFGKSIGTSIPGCAVLPRRGTDDVQAAEHLLTLLRTSLQWEPQQMEEARLSAYSLRQRFSWEKLYPNYQAAYHLAWS